MFQNELKLVMYVESAGYFRGKIDAYMYFGFL